MDSNLQLCSLPKLFKRINASPKQFNCWLFGAGYSHSCTKSCLNKLDCYYSKVQYTAHLLLQVSLSLIQYCIAMAFVFHRHQYTSHRSVIGNNLWFLATPRFHSAGSFRCCNCDRGLFTALHLLTLFSLLLSCEGYLQSTSLQSSSFPLFLFNFQFSLMFLDLIFSFCFFLTLTHLFNLIFRLH